MYMELYGTVYGIYANNYARAQVNHPWPHRPILLRFPPTSPAPLAHLTSLLTPGPATGKFLNLNPFRDQGHSAKALGHSTSNSTLLTLQYGKHPTASAPKVGVGHGVPGHLCAKLDVNELLSTKRG